MGLMMTASLPSAEDALYRKVMWRLLPFLFIAYVINYIDRTNVGFAQLQMKQQLGLGDAAFGLGAGVFFIGYALFEIPSNLLLARWGARATFLRIMVAWGLISALTAFVTTKEQFYVARFLLGVAEAGFAPGVLYYFGLWFPSRRRALAMAIFFAAFAAAPIASGPLASLIMTYLDGVQSLAGWQWLFILEGLPAVALGVVAAFWLTNRPAEADWLTTDEKRMLQQALDDEETQSDAQPTLLKAMADYRVWLLGLIYFLVLLGVYALTFWQPTMLQDLGLSIWNIGFISMIPAAVGIVAGVVVGRRSDQAGERRLHFAIAALIGACGLASTTFAMNSVALAVFCLSVATAGVAAAIPVFWAIPNALLSKRAAAGGIALINTIGIMAGALAPALVGVIKSATGGFIASLWILTAALVVSALLMLFAWRAPRSIAARNDVCANAA